jgi:uncharacterized MAPEG superfamily protein
MSIPMWSLIAFAGWTLFILLAGIGVSRWSKILTGRKQLTDFPADQPHGSVAYRRILRAHLNCVENLPVYAVIVLGLELGQVGYPLIDRLAIIVMGARILQSLTHMLFTETNLTVLIRFLFFIAQIICMIAMLVLLVMAKL